MILPDHAQAILNARMNGMRPADMILVSMVGVTGSRNPTVFAHSGVAYDWRFVRGLDVGVYMTDEHDWPDMVKAIALQRPDYLCIWNHEAKWGATIYLVPTADDVSKPVRYWKYELDFLPWMDFQNDDFKNGKTYEREALCI